MHSEITVGADAFAKALNSILEEYELLVDESADVPVSEVCKSTRDELRSTSPVKTGGYASGWTYTLKAKKKGIYGEIGNKDKPGLVHLLEKGHAKVGGGFVAPRVHVAPAADHAEKELVEKIKAALGNIE